MYKISLCMIVKNEDAMLPRALDNLGEFYDELIVVDTGSTDNTVVVAVRYDAEVLYYDWLQPGNKGEARNLGIDAATGDWIVVLDADEIIQQPEQLRDELLASDADSLAVTFVNMGPDGQPSLIWKQPRCFRRGAYRYTYREHEIPIAQHGGLIQAESECVFVHNPPEQRFVTKVDPMLARLSLDVEEHPTDTHPRYFFARQLLLADRYQDSIEQHIIYLGMANGLTDVCEAYGNLASCFHALGDHSASVKWLYEAIARQPHRRSWWLRLAEVYLHLNEVNLAQSVIALTSTLWPSREVNHEPKYYNGHLDRLSMECQARLVDSWAQHGAHAYAHGPHE